jgi:hypothetical protein
VNPNHIEELKAYLERSMSERGTIDTESLSKAILRATEFVVEEQERNRWKKLRTWVTPSTGLDPVSRFILRIANLFPGRPMVNGLLCGLIMNGTIIAIELLLFKALSLF